MSATNNSSDILGVRTANTIRRQRQSVNDVHPRRVIRLSEDEDEDEFVMPIPPRRPIPTDGLTTIEAYMAKHFEVDVETFSAPAYEQYMVNTFVRGETNGDLQTIGIDSSVEPSSVQLYFDLDSFVLTSYGGLPLVDQPLELYYRPNFDFSIKKDLGITWSVASVESGKRISLSRCPNMPIFRVGQVNVGIFFPGLYKQYKYAAPENAGVGGSFVAIDDHRAFVDDLLAPCVEDTVLCSAFPPPLDYEGAARAGVGHCSAVVTTGQANAIISRMRQRIEERPALSPFGEFFFVVYGHGLKNQFVVGDNFAGAYREGLRYIPIDWDSPDLSLDQLYVDLAMSFVLGSSPFTGLWSDSDYLLSIFFTPNPSNNRFKGDMRLDEFCQIRGLGGYRYRERSHHIVSLQAYSVSKHAFFKRNNLSDRQGRDIDPHEVWNQGKGFIKWVGETSRDLARMSDRGYAARLEFRVSAVESEWLLRKVTLSDTRAKIRKCIRWYPSKHLFAFVRCRLVALERMALNLFRQEFKYTYQHLSFASCLAYLFSTLLHRQLEHSQWDSVVKVLLDNSIHDSPCLFVPFLFVLENSQYWSVTKTLTSTELGRLFPSSLVSRCAPVENSFSSFSPVSVVDAPTTASSSVPSPSSTSGSRAVVAGPPFRSASRPAAPSASAAVASASSAAVLSSPAAAASVSASLGGPSGHLQLSADDDLAFAQARASFASLSPSRNYPGFDLLLARSSLESSLYGPYIKFDSAVDSYFWSLAQNIFMVFGIGNPRTCSFFCKLIFTEMVTLFNKWSNYGRPGYNSNSEMESVGYKLFKRDHVSQVLQENVSNIIVAYLHLYSNAFTLIISRTKSRPASRRSTGSRPLFSRPPLTSWPTLRAPPFWPSGGLGRSSRAEPFLSCWSSPTYYL
ncbi:MAG: hypothetical protein EXX96DRAFT_544108 [Benjaminiella poitrasii]|nr:MAG: hypothetical protein EXX96DRAFT_581545 [Benjaminiella poitrasii]KAI9485162.1 MAG: hypothetical protein EXX96DRAFT_544108 [Benjaminiella poitrasii]